MEISAIDKPLDLTVRKNNPVTNNKMENTSYKMRMNKNFLPCKVCNKYFDRPSLLKRHLRTHTGEKPHICEICNKGFSTSSSLNTHKRIHSGQKPHICGQCGKRFTASSNLYYHRMTHTKVKPHKCSLCPKSFPTPGDLKSHMYIHNGFWPFRCHICYRGFSKATNLKNHLVIHSGDKPYSCMLCGKRFALACNLKVHAKLHQDSSWTNREDSKMEDSKHIGYSSLGNVGSPFVSNHFSIFHQEVLFKTLCQIYFPGLFPVHNQDYIVHLH